MRRSFLIVAAIMLLGVPLPVLADNFGDDDQPDAPSGDTFRYDNTQKLQHNRLLGNTNSSVNITINSPWTSPPPSQDAPKRKAKPKRSASGEGGGFPTKHSENGDYDVTLKGCTKTDDVARCQVSITNDGRVRTFHLYGPHSARDNFGNEYRGSVAKRHKSNMEIESAATGSTAIEFTVTPNAGTLATLKLGIHCGDTEYFTFTQVQLETR
ncbi:hypothetical protein L4X63_02630 [Geomonas sp. Red32]|uniref:hypothetical protein n=1 Tax=Geomonas sp. Red32 TaxID=2912856 RepID=UPI00202CE0A1|nr:hypothetical protein [Geomonas sp. Red32]MCM0080476.1 hypothetical protein [Geomonas sp. Red32]